MSTVRIAAGALIAVLSGALLVGGGARATAAAKPFLAHRAVYELTLGSSSGDKSPASARGLIAYEFTGSACAGYITNFRQMTAIEPSDGAQRISDMRSTTFEDGSAKDFRFKIKTTVDDVKQDDLDGRATRASDGALSISLARPKPGKFEFQPGIVFPTEHLEHVLAAARNGAHELAVQAYDGSETGSKIYDTYTVIGKEIDRPADDAGGQDPALKSVPRWPVTISYFDPSKADGLPSYQLSFELYENGVSRALRLDYGNFVLDGKLSRFEALPAAPCNR